MTNLHSFSRYILIAAATLASSGALSACRLGNQVVKAGDPSALSGFYSTTPKAMSICAFVSGKDSQCASAATSMIPGVIQNIMTDPVYVSANTKTGKAIVLANSLDTQSYFEMTFQATGEMTAEQTVSDPQQLWDDPACTTSLSLQKEGKLSAAAQPSTSGSFKTSGSLEFSVAVLTSFSNQCTASLQALVACHEDLSQCPGATPQEQQTQQDSVHGFFAPYISHGVLTLEDIPHLEGFGWQADYQ